MLGFGLWGLGRCEGFDLEGGDRWLRVLLVFIFGGCWEFFRSRGLGVLF